MRIIGGKDYYDSAMAFGQDPKDVLVRHRHDAEDLLLASPKICPIGDLRRSTIRVRQKGTNGYGDERIPAVRGSEYEVHSFAPLRVWFAGKRYGGVRVRSQLRSNRAETDTLFVWNHEEFLRLLDEHDMEMAQRRRHDPSRFDAEGMRKHFEEDGSAAQKEWLIENRVSIAIWTRLGLWKDDKDGWAIDTDGLKEIGFSRRLDPWTAFQELSMYVGGVLPRPANPTVDLDSEKIMVQKHGFDEWTFRRMPHAR